MNCIMPCWGGFILMNSGDIERMARRLQGVSPAVSKSKALAAASWDLDETARHWRVLSGGFNSINRKRAAGTRQLEKSRPH